MKKLYQTNSLVGRRVSKSVSNEYGWIRDLRRGEVKFDKPVILCLAGDGTNDDRDANAIAKYTEAMLGRIGVADNCIQILSAQYKINTNNDFFEYSKQRLYFSEQDELFSENIKRPQYIKDIYDAIFKIAIVNSRGKRLSFDETQKRFRNITLFSHCHGTFVACAIIDYIKDDMEKYGYTKDEISKLLSEIVNIGISPRLGFHRNDGTVKVGFTMLEDTGADYTPKLLIEDAGEGCVSSKLKIGLKKEKTAMYFIGDSLNYTQREIEETFLPDAMDFMHGLRAYIEPSYIYKDFTYRKKKTELGKNFAYLITKVLQNAVSLSTEGKKRTSENITSNETKVAYKQGNINLNKNAINVRFYGNNEEFQKEYNDFVKQKQLQSAERELSKLMEDDGDSLKSAIYLKNQRDI